MIIQCPECQTRFRMADDKLKPEGTKVRCSRCRHIFAVSPPEAESQAAPAPSPAAPMAAAATQGEEEVDFGAFNMQSVAADAEAQPGADETSGAAATQGPEEEEAEEPPAGPDLGLETAAPSQAGDSSHLDLSGPSPDESAFSFDEPAGGEGIEFSFDRPEQDADEITFDFPPEEEAAGVPTEPATFSFGEDEDNAPAEEFSFAAAAAEDFAEEDAAGLTPAEFSFAEEPAAEPGETLETEEFSVEGNGFAFEESEAAWGEPDSSSDFDFEDPAPTAKPEEDEFDFSNLTFGEEEPPQAEAAPPPKPETQPEPEAVSFRPRETPEETGDEPAPLVMPPDRRRRSPISGVLTFVVLLLLALSGAAGYLFWQGDLPTPTQMIDRLAGQAAPAAPAGQVRVTDLSGYFVNNKEAGQLFVIQGKAINEFNEARSAIAVKGILYDRNGQPILQQTVFSGNLLEEAELQTLSFAQIEERMNNQFGDSLSNLNVGTGKAIPFSIIFRNMPADLAEFTVEVADSRPGSET